MSIASFCNYYYRLFQLRRDFFDILKSEISEIQTPNQIVALLNRLWLHNVFLLYIKDIKKCCIHYANHCSLSCL